LATLDAKQDGQTAILEELLARTAPSLPLATAQAILADFGNGEIPDDPDQIARLLRSAAEQYQAMRARLLEYDNSADLIVRDLSHAAQALVEQGRFDEADAKLGDIELHSDLVKAKARGDRGDLARLRLRYRDAAGHFAQAAQIVPPDQIAARWLHELRRADSLTALGKEFGDNAALREAVELYRNTVLPLAPRWLRPIDWASTHDCLGNALRTLGQREAGNDCLKEAISSYELALQERARDCATAAWAATLNGLGTVLTMLGERGVGKNCFEQAIGAFQQALNVCDPTSGTLGWSIQNNLWNALKTLGEREDGTTRLEEAVSVFRRALESCPRALAPLDWATTQNNLGTALRALGARETGTHHLEEAIVAIRLSLDERPQDRVPLDWASSQNNLGTTLGTLGQREERTASFELAVAAFREAQKERTQFRAPFLWAVSQMNLAKALAEIARRTDGDRSEPLAAIDAALEVFRESGVAALIENGEAIRRSITGEDPA